VWTLPGNMFAKFEVRSFECIGSIDSGHQLQYKIDGPKFADPSIAAVSPYFKRPMYHINMIPWMSKIKRCRFYRAMHFSAYVRSWDRMSSVRLSVCDVGGL